MFSRGAVISNIPACAEKSITTEGGGQLGDTPESLLATVLLLGVEAELVMEQGLVSSWDTEPGEKCKTERSHQLTCVLGGPVLHRRHQLCRSFRKLLVGAEAAGKQLCLAAHCAAPCPPFGPK